ncbi:pirin family protein [Pigmentiphaga sp.]|uniref:pirin family protein n=1 Tax=Pigmentiphaga sp. TaxID=1977564 RepID=UPI00128B6D9B|nr:pirin family protein [Pigmentiphaga sp.]MPS30066.1 pirin family protein [Alcaligenaceae bacterium SAGV5]MPS51838.1 pirin family protein [Alcaligenaceae bacterium SAGV3]MPT56029.1 pirin family protein [Alcaligenaceae bacterium]
MTAGHSGIERIESRTAQIGGGISVDRVLPVRQRRRIGAWCFLDHAGPARFEPGEGMLVEAHPHIGLQTFTWLIEGEALHRDSLGNEQILRPGQVNLMTAGIGISHTEESLPDQRVLHAAQLWIALPPGKQEMPPAFDHYPDLPRWSEAGLDFTLLAGSHAGRTAPTRVHTPLVGMDLQSPVAATLRLALEPAFEHGLLVLEGAANVEGERFGPNELAYVPTGREGLDLSAEAGSRLLLIGGEPPTDDITIWWNFVGSKSAIAQAQRDWEARSPRFGPVKGYEDRRLVAPPVPW